MVFGIFTPPSTCGELTPVLVHPHSNWQPQRHGVGPESQNESWLKEVSELHASHAILNIMIHSGNTRGVLVGDLNEAVLHPSPF